MQIIRELFNLPLLWLLIIGLIAISLVIKLIRSVVGKIMSIVFTGVALIKIYLLLTGKF